jgi:hypothetical protein
MMNLNMFKETAVAYFKLSSQYFLGMTEEIQKNPCHYSLFSDPASSPQPPKYRAGISTICRDILSAKLIDL